MVARYLTRAEGATALAGVALLGLAAALPAHPVLSVTPLTVAVSATVGTATAPQTVTVRNAGNGALKWATSTPTASWLTVSPSRGTNAATLTLSFAQFDSAGTYRASFVVSGNGQAATVTVTVTVGDQPAPPDPPPPDPPPAPASAVGPQPTIVCPSGAVDEWPWSNLTADVAFYPAGTTFCLHAGVFPLVAAITPKSGDTFVGEYGAILDGSGWTTSDPTQGAFRAHNQDIDDVTIRNLVIRNMPQAGIHAFKDFSDRWTIDHNEIAGNLVGVLAPNGSLISRNFVHHNAGDPASPNYALRGAGYQCYQCVGTTFDANEFAFNGTESKIVGTQNVTFRGNYVHDQQDGIWFDGANVGALIESDRVEDVARNGIFYEVSGQAAIRQNQVSRAGDTGIFISASHDVSVTGNLLEENFRGVGYFVDCGRVANGVDLANVQTAGNTVRVPTTPYAFATGLSWTNCTPEQSAPYVNGQKGLTFEVNTYTVPTLSGRYWVWGFNHFVDWTAWLAIPQDATGTVAAQGEMTP